MGMAIRASKYLAWAAVAVFLLGVAVFAEQPAPVKKASAGQKITMDFVDVELATFAKFISETTGENLVFDDRLKGRITIISPSGLDRQQTFELFSSVLELKGFTLVPSGAGAYKIIPSSEARQKGVPSKALVNDSYTIRLIQLSYISPDEAVKFLSPMASKDGHISAFATGNYLLVIDTGPNIAKFEEILQVIDAPPDAGDSDVIVLRNASAETVARILNEGADKARGPRATAEPRLNAVVLLGSRSEKEAMKRLIGLLDVPAEAEQGGINVCFLEHANASELAETLKGLIQAQPQQPGKQSPAVSEKITITPDKPSNSLVISASQADYQSILSIIKQLDRPRRQVFVEAMIVEASVDGLRELGARWRVTARKDGEPVFIGGVGAIDNEQLLNIVNGLSGLTLGGIGNLFNITVVDPATGQNRTITVPGYAALFSLSDFRNLVNVLSTPQILTSDNQEAEIVVGENVPIVARRDVGTTGASVLSSAIERRDVGIKLRITPHITEGEAVRLEIYQEISAVKDTPPDTDATAILTEVGPTLTLRSTKTSVVVNDGQTIVIGGLMSERTDNTVDKVPVLGDIPVLGYLFKNTSARKQKTNLLVFISPSVVKGGEGMAKLTEEKKEEFGRQETRSAYKASELIVKFRKGVRAEEAQAIIRARGWSVISNPRELLYVVRISPSEEPNEAAAGLSGQLQVEYAEPNYILKID